MAIVRLSNKLALKNGDLIHYCPACVGVHRIPVAREDFKNWLMEGTVNTPTVRPSVRIISTRQDGTEITICHYILEKGLLNYCNDNYPGHKYNNMVIPLPDLPEHYGRE